MGDCPKKGSPNPSSHPESLKLSISQDFEIPEKKKVKQLGLYAERVESQLFHFYGATDVTRTHDLLITNQLLYRLSYSSIL